MDEPQALRLPVNKIYEFIAKSDKIFQSNSSTLLVQNDGSSVNSLEYVTTLVKKFHVVKRGEGLATIADQYNCTIGDIKRWNKIKRSKVLKGQRLLVYVPESKPAKSTAQTVGAKNKSNAAVSKKSSEPIAGNNNKGMQSDLSKSDSALNFNKATVDSEKVVNAGNNNNNSTRTGNTIITGSFVWHIVQPGDTLWKIAKHYDGVTVEEIKAINNLSSNEITPGTKLKVKVTG